MKKIKNWIIFDGGSSLLGLFLGIILFLFIWKISNNIWISLIYSIIIALLITIFIQIRSFYKYKDAYAIMHDKDKYIDPKYLRGYSENFDKLLDLDKEISAFFTKHTKYDYFEKELNKEWSIHGNDFVKRADDILSTMDNEELLYALLGTKTIEKIIDVCKYFKPYKINVEYLKEHPEKAKEYYIDNLMQQDAIKSKSINKYYYKAIMNLNNFDEIEKAILSNMSNDDLMELANSSNDWREKLYFYGFIKSDDNK